jgi:hypothetical protein
MDLFGVGCVNIVPKVQALRDLNQVDPVTDPSPSIIDVVDVTG